MRVDNKTVMKEDRTPEKTTMNNATSTSKDGSNSAIRWERFLPRRVIRVLLVEVDDSTRQIISTLLRKCSYKVAAVPDGLKAWEVLKGRPHNIDLILTEVDLPSISGFALLTLVMEHEICKNIPVIMMSSHDSVSTVYKCMLRGAADFLVKPIRINELRNIWQHVWRRQSSNVTGSGPQGESTAVQQKREATAENNAASASLHSSGSKACLQTKKGSDDQSSCTKPDMEVESAYMEEERDQSQPNTSKSQGHDVKLQEGSSNVDNSSRNSFQRQNGKAGEALDKNSNIKAQYGVMRPDSNEETATRCSDVGHKADGTANPPREAIDLIGKFGNHIGGSFGDSNSNQEENIPELTQLDLSLRRFQLTAAECEKQTLNPSSSSAFSRYVNKTSQPLHTTPISVCGSREDKTNFCNHMSDDANNCGSGDRLATPSHHHGTAVSIHQAGQQNVVLHPNAQQNLFHIPVPVRGIRSDGLYAGGYGSITPILCSSSAPKQIIVNQLEPCTEVNQFKSFISERVNPTQNSYNPHDQSPNMFSTTCNSSKQDTINTEERTNFPSATDQSASSILYNGGGVSNMNSYGYGSVCGSNSNNLNSGAVGTGRMTSESGNEDNTFAIPDSNCLRSFQREAALTKFRQKRKDRCFEKKVLYESRKKLAEQRPRVKGQFVRQVPPDPLPTE